MAADELTSYWMHVSAFTVNQASALWCGVDPASIGSLFIGAPSEAHATKQMLVAAIVGGELKADSSTNSLTFIGDYSGSLVSRHDLEDFARKRKLFPAFLFDTLAPFGASSATPLGQFQASNVIAPRPIHSYTGGKGGRPQEYDWNSFMLEIIRRANLPDGLPETQAELIRDMLLWFRDTYDAEPAESSVKSRISKIYGYLGEAKNPLA
ncbi:hypothetical protein VSX64_12230 [Aurantimonas sp. C2-6-R+9]|uniref:hypothetical protein n=1 Tax=unclassified Aurantimonas TaxID=2638230 RepID=UPI002E17BEA4|nr:MULTISPECIES: hypothetical protein [unclassified Aurantimonas]MEC5291491.1 hypothetical protein [Aurantimonas sp. C2-3-R2]MEC5381639.1 hypothetical protein [Aurantimonas sp. C2-6-R+9]MEC5412577.1 hypothetical protein [Aurantimonas sp. C2-4-R8]